MIYLTNSRDIQDVYIPRQDIINVAKQGIDLSQYLTSGETIELIDEMVESATTDFVTSGDVQTQINDSISGIPTQFKTINDESIIGEGNIEIEGGGAAYTAGQNIDISGENVISVTGITVPDVSEFVTSGDVETLIDAATSDLVSEAEIEDFVTSGDVKTQIESYGYLTEHQSLSAYSTTQQVETMIENAVPDVTDFVTSGDVQTQINDSISGIPTEFKTINNQSIIGEGNVQIDGAIYSAGTNISISEQNVISVTGITVPDVSNFVTSGEVKTQIESYDYITSAAIPTSNTAFTNDAGYLTEHQSLSAYSTTDEVETLIDAATSDFITDADIADFVTSGDVATQVESYGYITSAAIPTSNTAFTNDAGYLTEHQSLSAYSTTQQVEQLIDNATSGIPTEFKTINNESIVGQGNIQIEGGGEQFVELTKAQYQALEEYAEDTTYIITDADTVDLNDFALESAVTSAITEINNSLDSKANKANISNHNTRQFPTWNTEGIITGTTGNTLYEVSHTINGSSRTVLSNSSSNLTGIYAPTSVGTKNQVLLSNGSGAPVWSGYKFVFCSQSDYDGLATKDSTTIYFIVDEN